MTQKKISIIVATDNRGLIGKGNELPWSFSEDLQYFKEKTMGKFVIMGDRTYRSIGKSLPGRKVIVLSKSGDLGDGKVQVADSIESALAKTEGEVMVAGGASVYKQFLEIANRIYLTMIDKEFEGDVYFPKFNKSDWVVSSEKKGDNNLLNFQILERKR